MKEEYRDLFLTEFRDLITRLEKSLLRLRKGDHTGLKEAYRILHTIKGSSGVMGYQSITETAHHAEETIKEIQEGKVKINQSTIQELYQSLELFKRAYQAVTRKEPIPARDIIPIKVTIEESPFSGARAMVIISAARNLGRIVASTPSDKEISSGWSGTDIIIRIHTTHPEEEIIRSLSEIPEVLSVTAYEPGISIPEVKIPPEELDRILALVSELTRNFETIESRLTSDQINAISSILTHLRNEILNIRLIPLSELFRQFPNWFRSESFRLKKEAELIITGGEIEVDRSLFEYLREPIIHILLNALVHGIDPKKKGLVNLDAKKEGDYLVVAIKDNGFGIDPDKVVKRAIELGIIDRKKATGLTPELIYSLLTNPRFSMLKSTTKLGGRGIGLDIVRKKMEEIGGRLQIESEPRRGAKFILTIPLSLAIVKSMIITVGKFRFAIPVSTLRDSMKLDEGKIKTLLGSRFILYNRRPVPVIYLNEYFGSKSNGRFRNLIISRIENRNYA
ncbi:MAG TPA: hypothetical protein EYP24_03195, partial [bacterium (Candidatus Stahlbacteria)]|nr:hypothetical protein [Candidatus Stahlbacteria bacterium]